MAKTTLILGADHAGFVLKEAVKKFLRESKISFQDLSPEFHDGDDYPEHAFNVAAHVAGTENTRGLLFCGSGVGMVIAANRLNGARAFDGFDEETVKLARQDNDANIMALSGWHVTPAKAKKLIQAFLKSPSSKLERHKRRVKQLDR